MNTIKRCVPAAITIAAMAFALLFATPAAAAKLPPDVARMKPYESPVKAKKPAGAVAAARAAYAGVRDIRRLAYVPVTGWLLDPSAAVRSAKPDADTSGLKKVELPFGWSEGVNCMFRAAFIVPDKVSGFVVAGGGMAFEFAGKGTMDIFLNGKRVSGFTGSGSVDISDRFKPGETVILAVKLTEMTNHGKLDSVVLHVKALDAFDAPAGDAMSLLDNAAMLLEQLPDPPKALTQAVDASAKQLAPVKKTSDIAQAAAGLEKMKTLLAPVPALLEKYPLFNAGPALQNVKKDEITVTWETRVPAPSAVYYGTAGLTNAVSDPAPVQFHKVVIKGLKEQTLYKYVAVSAKLAAPASTFRTAIKRNTPFTFTVHADSQDGPAVLGRLAEMMIKQKPDIFFSIGDEVGCGINYETWAEQIFSPLRNLIIKTPYFVAIGNHEYCEATCGKPVKWFDEYISTPAENSGYYYAVTYGNSRFIMLNMQGEDGCAGAIPGTKQYEWLLKELESPEYKAADFHFLFMHQPPYSEYWGSSFKYQGEDYARQYLVPLIDKYHIDIMFSGHVHEYERGRWPKQDGAYYVITGGGGGALDNIFVKDWPQIDKHDSVYHFSTVSIKGKKLSFKATDINGKVIDKFEIKK